jgi:hypothetical protein
MSAPPKATKCTLGFPHDGFDIETRATAERGGKKGDYKPIAKEFCHDGFTFRQIVREGDVAIYEQKWNGCANPSVAYEVVRIRRREAREIKGKIIEAAEVYPRNEQWSECGWTVPDKESAFCKLRELVNSPQKESANPVKKSPIQNTERCSETRDLRGDVKNRRDG